MTSDSLTSVRTTTTLCYITVCVLNCIYVEHVRLLIFTIICTHYCYYPFILQAPFTWRFKKSRRRRRRKRRGKILVLGDSNFSNVVWKRHPLFSIAGGGATFFDVPYMLSFTCIPKCHIRAVIIALGINHRPDMRGWREAIVSAIRMVRERFPNTPV